MPAANRPRRSSRVKPSTPTKETPAHKSASTQKKRTTQETKKKKDDYDETHEDALDDGALDDLYDSPNASSDDDDDENEASVMPWQKKSKKASTIQEVNKKLIPKRKKEMNQNQDVNVAEVEEITRKKKKLPIDDKKLTNATTPNTTSLIANMEPSIKAQRQPAIRDWKSKEDYKAFRSKPFGGGSGHGNAEKMNAKNKLPTGNQPHHPNQHQLPIDHQQQQSKSYSMGSTGNSEMKLKGVENRIRKDLEGIIFKVLENVSASEANSKIPIDVNGSFLRTSADEEDYDFGDFDEYPQVPMFPEEFKNSKRKEWPLTWWGIQPPSDELLDIHDGGSRSKRKHEREREREREGQRDVERDRDRGRGTRGRDGGRDGERRSRDREFERNRGNGGGAWRGDRRPGGPPGSGSFRGDGRYDHRGPPPGDGPYPHAYGPPRGGGGGGGWQDQRMHDDGWRGPYGPGPGRGGHGPGPGFGSGRGGHQHYSRR